MLYLCRQKCNYKNFKAMKKIFSVSCLLLTAFTVSIQAQRFTDRLDRGIVATPSATNSGNFITWRRFGEEYYDTKYNLYANGTLIARNLDVCNYVHAAGNASTSYQVAPVVRGTEKEKSASVVRWSGCEEYWGHWNPYLDVPGQPVVNRSGTDVTYNSKGELNYWFNDVSLADVDGDGIPELIAKRNSNDWTLGYNTYECYKIDGTRLWWIDMGPNFGATPDEQNDLVAYDWDEDGKAELLMRGVNNMEIHMADGTVKHIGNNDVYSMGLQGFIGVGDEFLLYMEGATAKPYFEPIVYPIARGKAEDWGDGYGHRSTKHYFGAPYLDGRHPFIYLGRGCYTMHKMKAFSVDPLTHQLSEYWSWECTTEGSPYFGQGYHNFAIGDVDMDGRDEIIFGSMVIDDNGKGLSTTGLGHGDAQHCSDLDPYRWGLEQFACLEHHPCNDYRNATTSKIYFRTKGTGDDGRALAGNFSNKYPGAQGATMGSGGTVSLVADKVIPGADGFDLNSRIYWDGDLCEEVLNSPGLGKAPKVDKVDVGRIFLGAGNMNNGSKNNPGAVGDIFGDWREEMVITCGNALRIFMSNWPSSYGLPTLWHDHMYRNAMVWQCVGYNQPPHLSYYLGELEKITVAPPPLTNTDRLEIKDGGTISTKQNGQHVMIADYANTHISVAEGASPWVVTFNIPSWVQGKNSTATDGNPDLDATYYSCEVTGAPFTGDTRVVKQGEGLLTLPKVTQTYSGQTDVWNGVLRFDGTLEHSNVWLNRFTKLVSDGGTFRNIDMRYGAELIIGATTEQRIDFTELLSPLSLFGTDKVSTLTAEDVTMEFGARLLFDVMADGSCDRLMAKKLTIGKQDWKYGPKYDTPVFVFNLDGEWQASEYVIATIDELSGDLADVRIEGVPNTFSSKLERRDRDIVLVVETLRAAQSIVWNGSESDIWDFAKTANFLNGSETDWFVTGDSVLFDDSSAKATINLLDNVEAGELTFDATKAYVINGNGSLTGTTSLVKKGTGKLTVNTDNTYTGGNRISEGTVIVSTLANENLAYGALGSMTISADDFIIENGAALQTTAAVTQGSPMSVQGEGGGIINNAADFNLDKPISGNLLTKKGNGWLKYNVPSPSLKRLVVEGGTVQMVTNGRPATTVELKNGALIEFANCGSAIEVPERGKGSWTLSNRQTYSNTVTGAGTLTIVSALDGSGAPRTPIACNFKNFTGTIEAHAVNNGSGWFTLDNSGGIPLGTLNIPEGVTVVNTAKTFRVGKVTGKGALGEVITYSQTAASGANTWEAGDDGNFTFAGIVKANANFNKVGTGKMTVQGAWSNTGQVQVKAGELHLTNTAKLGTGRLTVAKNAILSGITKSNEALTNSAYNINGFLQVGLSATSTTGVINFGGKNVIFSKTAVLDLGIASPATATKTGGTSIQDIGKLTMNGTVRLRLKEGIDWQVGDSIILWRATSFTGSPIIENYIVDESKGLFWDDSRINEGILTVTNIPTAIQDTHVAVSKPTGVYDLQGRRVASNINESILPNGIYIIVENGTAHKIYKYNSNK